MTPRKLCCSSIICTCPGRTPLTNTDTRGAGGLLRRIRFAGTPTVLFNGNRVPGETAGAARGRPKRCTRIIVKIADPLLEAPARRPAPGRRPSAKGDKIHIKATVADSRQAGRQNQAARRPLSRIGHATRGANGLSYYHQVVRAFPRRRRRHDPVQKGRRANRGRRPWRTCAKSLSKYLDSAAKEEPFLDSQRPHALSQPERGGLHSKTTPLRKSSRPSKRR